MLTIVADDVGRHDFLLTPCSPETFAIIYQHTGEHPSCFGNLVMSLAAFDTQIDSLPLVPDDGVTFVISQAPVFGIPWIERKQKEEESK